MSSKINKMETQFKQKNVKNLFSSGQLKLSVQQQSLQFRKEKAQVLKAQRKVSEKEALDRDTLRKTWDDGENFTFNVEEAQRERKMQKSPSSKLIDNLTESFRINSQKNPQFGKSSAQLKMSQEHNRMEIQRVEGTGFPKPKLKNENLFKTKTLLKSQTFQDTTENSVNTINGQ